MAVEPGDPRPSDDDLPPDPFPGDPFGDGAGGAADGADIGSGPDFGSLQDLLGSLGLSGAGAGGGAGLGALGPLFAALGGQGAGGLNWDTARQLAVWTAAGGSVEANVDPMERIRLEELVKAAAPIVADTTGLEVPASLKVQALSRAAWAAQALEDHRGVFERLARAVGSTSSDAGTDPLGQIFRIVGPMMTSGSIGALVGQLGATSLATYDAPLPRSTDQLTFVPSSIAAFAREWSISVETASMHVVLADLIAHAVLRLPHVGGHLLDALGRYVDAARIDTDGLNERIEGLMEGGGMPDPAAFGAMSAPNAEQQLRQVEIDDLLTPIVGFIEYATMVVGARLLGDNRQVVEAWRRRRGTESDGSRQLADLLGVRPPAAYAERGGAFVGGVIQRAGSSGLAALWAGPSGLPTRAELDAPGLWLARIDLA